MCISKLKRLIANKTASHWGSITHAREKYSQISIYETFAEHEIGQKLKPVSE